jgi:hypothetical protein
MIEDDDLVEDFFKDDEDEHIFLDAFWLTLGLYSWRWRRLEIGRGLPLTPKRILWMWRMPRLEKEVCRQHLVFE